MPRRPDFYTPRVSNPQTELRDDRGVPIASISYEQLQGDREGITLLHALLESKSELADPIPPARLVISAAVIVAAIAMIVALPRLVPSLPPLAAGAVAGLFILIGIRISHSQMPRRYPLAIISTFLAHGRCPGCGYRLAGIVAMPDGMVLCPECGAAWHAHRIGASATAHPACLQTARKGWLRAPVILDDHQRAVPLMNPSARSLGGRLSGQRLDDAVRQLREATILRRLAIGLPLLMLIVLVSISAASAANKPLVLLGCGAGVAMWSWWLIRLFLNRSAIVAKPLRAACLSLDLCPSCATDLRGVPPDADGTTPCPTCSACWRVSSASSSNSAE